MGNVLLMDRSMYSNSEAKAHLLPGSHIVLSDVKGALALPLTPRTEYDEALPCDYSYSPHSFHTEAS